MLKTGTLAVASLAILTVVGCTRIPAVVDVREVKPILQQINSPDGTVQAILTYKGYGGAAGSEVYLVYVRQKDARRAYLVLTGLHLKDPRFSWPSSSVLDISMACGDVQSFQNFFYFFEEGSAQQRKITINLDSQGQCPPFS